MYSNGVKMKILIVDDEKHIRTLLKDYLENEGYQTQLCADGEEALAYVIDHRDIDLILLDVRMPKMNGFDTLENIRDYSQVPVLFLTALNDVAHEVKGLTLGADDYISKPFTYDILMARIKMCLRRANKFEVLTVGTLSINIEKAQVLLDKEQIDLTQKELLLLKVLIEHKDVPLKRLSLLDQVWGFDFEGDPRTLDTHIKTLRHKLKEAGKHIKTIRGVGYRFET